MKTDLEDWSHVVKQEVYNWTHWRRLRSIFSKPLDLRKRQETRGFYWILAKVGKWNKEMRGQSKVKKTGRCRRMKRKDCNPSRGKILIHVSVGKTFRAYKLSCRLRVMLSSYGKVDEVEEKAWIESFYWPFSLEAILFHRVRGKKILFSLPLHSVRPW